MNLDKLVAVSGIGGIHKIAANRDNGIIIQNYETGKKRFIGSRKHQFTPLGSVTIYSQDPEEIIKLSDVFEAMLEKKGTLPPPATSSSKEELHKYFAEIIPKYDPEQVHASDMKKIIKWFNYLDKHNIFSQLEAKEEKEKEKKEEEKEKEEPKNEKEEPAKEKTTKAEEEKTS